MALIGLAGQTTGPGDCFAGPDDCGMPEQVAGSMIVECMIVALNIQIRDADIRSALQPMHDAMGRWRRGQCTAGFQKLNAKSLLLDVVDVQNVHPMYVHTSAILSAVGVDQQASF